MNMPGNRQRHRTQINWAIIGFLLVFLLLAARGSGAGLPASMIDPSSGQIKQAASIRSNQSAPVYAYLLAIDLLMDRAQTQARWLKYLAIDATSLVGGDNEAREVLFANLEKYGLAVLDKGREQLEAEKYIENLIFREGYLIDIKIRNRGFLSLSLDAVLYHSGAGAFGWRGMIFAKQGGKWFLENDGGWFIA